MVFGYESVFNGYELFFVRFMGIRVFGFGYFTFSGIWVSVSFYVFGLFRPSVLVMFPIAKTSNETEVNLK